jgi:hypothetical protein
MIVIAIIGPFNATTTEGILQNVHRARDLADEVWKLGAVAYCPHTSTCHLFGVLPESLFYAAGVEMAQRCDAGMLVRGWQHSQGSWREKTAMEAQGKPVFERLEDLATWLATAQRPGGACAGVLGSICEGAMTHHPDRPYAHWTITELQAEYAMLARRVAALQRQTQDAMDMAAALASEIDQRKQEPS